VLGTAQTAAALLAMEHFNTRNGTVVPELAHLLKNNDSATDSGCDLYFDVEESAVFDTGTATHLASRTLALEREQPCAIAGPFNDLPALDLSTMAQAYGYPLVINRAFNLRATRSLYAPYSSQMYPDIIENAEVLVQFLQHKGRTNYTSILYDLSDTSVQRRDWLTLELDKAGMRHYEAQFVTPDQLIDASLEHLGGINDVYTALSKIKRNGYRTIVVSMFDPVLELPPVAQAAVELGMTGTDEWLWIWFAPTDTWTQLITASPEIRAVMSGSATVVPIERYRYEPNHAFSHVLREHGVDLVDVALQAGIIRHSEVVAEDLLPENVAAADEYRTTESVADALPGVGFMYDAVIAVGIGMCRAAAAAAASDTNTTTAYNTTATAEQLLQLQHQHPGGLSGWQHLAGIRSVDFQGVSGRVRFSDADDPDAPGARQHGTVAWGAVNVPNLQQQKDEGGPIAVLTDIYLPGPHLGIRNWTELNQTFLYADGSTGDSALLRTPPERHYLYPGVRILGYVLYGSVIVAASGSATWVFLCRKHAVFVAAQPLFLYMIALGAIVFASAIVPASMDEQTGLTAEQLGMACMSIPWLVSLGHVITYAALFAKLWRVDKVLQPFQRRKIETRHVLWPVIALVIASVVLLIIWTTIDPVRWERLVINVGTGETIGQCTSDHGLAFALSLLVMMLIPTALTLYMAWKTKDVDDTYAESSWIFAMVLVQVQVFIVAIPLIVILLDVSANGRYIGAVILLWFFPKSAIGFIFVPKFTRWYREVKGIVAPKRKRGARNHISAEGEISGLSGGGNTTGGDDGNGGSNSVTTGTNNGAITVNTGNARRDAGGSYDSSSSAGLPPPTSFHRHPEFSTVSLLTDHTPTATNSNDGEGRPSSTTTTTTTTTTTASYAAGASRRISGFDTAASVPKEDEETGGEDGDETAQPDDARRRRHQQSSQLLSQKSWSIGSGRWPAALASMKLPATTTNNYD